MKEALFTYCKVTCAFDWQKENDYSTYHFGSVSGAQEWIADNIGKLVWYSIEELEVRPCNENNPSGQLYYGMGYFEFKDKDDLKELKGGAGVNKIKFVRTYKEYNYQVWDIVYNSHRVRTIIDEGNVTLPMSVQRFIVQAKNKVEQIDRTFGYKETIYS